MKPWSVWLATLAIVGLFLAWVQSCIAADEPKLDNFALASTSVKAFLAALEAKDRARLAEATALDAPTKARERNQKLFLSILAQSLSDEELAKLAREFEGYKIAGRLRPDGRPGEGVVVMKTEENGSQFLRVISTDREKGGWRVIDFSQPTKKRERPPR